MSERLPLVVDSGVFSEMPAGDTVPASVIPTPTAITVANEGADTTCFPLFATAATGNLSPKTNGNLTFDSATGTLGVARINKVTITTPATSATLTIANGKVFTCNNTLTFTGTDSSSIAFGAGGTVAYVANKLSVFAATTSSELAGVISDETGTGSLVFATSPTFITQITTPIVKVGNGTSSTPSIANATNPNNGFYFPSSSQIGIAKSGSLIGVFDDSNPNTPTFTLGVGIPLSGAIKTGVFESTRPNGEAPIVTASSTVCTNLNADLLDGMHAASFGVIASPLSQFASTTSSQLAGVISDETGTGALVFATSPTLIAPVLGVASATSIMCPTFTTSSGAIDVTPAAGSGLNITVSGAGVITLNGPVKVNGTIGIGTNPVANTQLITSTVYTETSGAVYGGNIAVFNNPGSNSSATLVGAQVTARITNGNIRNHSGEVIGGLFIGSHQGTGIVSSVSGGQFSANITNSGVITKALSGLFYAPSTSGGGVITSSVGCNIRENSAGTNNTNLLIGTATFPTGNFSIYNASINQNYFAGNVGIGAIVPGDKLHSKVGTTDAVECLQLEQLDVSEGFVNFVSTSAANTTNPLTTLTAGNTIQGFARIEVNGTDQWMPFYNAPTM